MNAHNGLAQKSAYELPRNKVCPNAKHSPGGIFSRKSYDTSGETPREKKSHRNALKVPCGSICGMSSGTPDEKAYGGKSRQNA